jgi:MFS superfamily sulfate permease-like transporter
VSFLNKPIIKNKLEEIPAEASVLIDTSRADFIDKDIIEVIEDFAIHAPLKNIRVQVKASEYKEQGFSKTILFHQNQERALIRKTDSELENVEP